MDNFSKTLPASINNGHTPCHKALNWACRVNSTDSEGGGAMIAVKTLLASINNERAVANLYHAIKPVSRRPAF